MCTYLPESSTFLDLLTRLSKPSYGVLGTMGLINAAYGLWQGKFICCIKGLLGLQHGESLESARGLLRLSKGGLLPIVSSYLIVSCVKKLMLSGV